MKSMWNGFNAKCKKKHFHTKQIQMSKKLRKKSLTVLIASDSFFPSAYFSFFQAHMHSSDANKSWTFIKSGPRS